jgi:hypothetical protein
MKRFVTGFIIGAVISPISIIAVWWLVSGVGSFVSVGSSDAILPTQTNSAGGLKVEYGGDAQNIVFSRAGQTFTLTQAKGEQCRDAVVSPDGKAALLLINSESSTSYGYGYILGLDFSDASLTNGVPHRLLPQPKLNAMFGGAVSWVGEFYKFSSSGDRVLLDVSTMRPISTNTSRSFRHIYWYNISSNTLEEP